MRPTRLHALSMTSEGESRRRLLEADFTSFKMACVASLIASVTSVEGSVIVRGSPSTWSRPRTSERDLLLQRQALPIWILTPQRPLADDQVVSASSRRGEHVRPMRLQATDGAAHHDVDQRDDGRLAGPAPMSMNHVAAALWIAVRPDGRGQGLRDEMRGLAPACRVHPARRALDVVYAAGMQIKTTA